MDVGQLNRGMYMGGLGTAWTTLAITRSCTTITGLNFNPVRTCLPVTIPVPSVFMYVHVFKPLLR
jgi:hypothetical protein